MIYLDTSYLTKLYIDEPGAAEVVAWAEGCGDFVCAAHGRIELTAAFKRKQREDSLSGAQIDRLIRTHAQDVAQGLIRWLAIETDLIETTCDKLAALPPAIFLRAADALHLACAAENGCKEIYSHDRHLLAAAPHFGLRGLDVISSAKKK